MDQGREHGQRSVDASRHTESLSKKHSLAWVLAITHWAWLFCPQARQVLPVEACISLNSSSMAGDVGGCSKQAWALDRHLVRVRGLASAAILPQVKQLDDRRHPAACLYPTY